MNVLDTLSRKIDLRTVARPREHIRQRLATSAQELSRAGRMAARVELVNEALHKAVTLLYQADHGGGWANVDEVTGRVLIPLPWGSAGWEHYGLRQWEGRALNRILRGRLAAWTPAQRPPLLQYDAGAWFLNRPDYPAIEAALFWLQRTPVTLGEWRKYVKRYVNR